MYLVDTNVLSATAPTRTVSVAALHAWMDRNSAGLFLSVVTIAEIEEGIAKSRRQGGHRKADQLSSWLQGVLHLYGDRVLPIDVMVARRIGAIADAARAQGHAPGLADLAIAATAQCRAWTVLTRNLKHFVALGGPIIDPFEVLPSDFA